MWNALFSTFTVLICAYVILRSFPGYIRGVKAISLTALSLWLLSVTIDRIGIEFSEIAVKLLQSLSLSLLLVLFLTYVREGKPTIFRYPVGMTLIPLIIPAAHAVVLDVEIMNTVIFMTVQGAGIVVFILLGLTYFNSIRNKSVFILGILSLIWGFLFFWILKEYYTVYSWAWSFANSMGMICSVYTFSDLLQKHKNERT